MYFIYFVCFVFIGNNNNNNVHIYKGSYVYLTKQYNLVPAKAVISLAGKVTMGLVESNDSLPPGL